MTGGQKSGVGGTDPQAAGPNPQTPAQRGHDEPQQKTGMIEKMEKPSRPDPATIDRWFDRQLNQLYSEVISEPLPKEFLELIDQLREKSPEK